MSDEISWAQLNPVRFVALLGRRSGRPLSLRVFLAPMVVAALLLWPVFLAYQLPILLLKELARHLQRFRIVQWLTPLFTWELWRGSPAATPHPYDLLARERALRCVLLPVVAAEWLALLVIGFTVGISCLLGRAPSHRLVLPSLGVLVLMSLPAMALHSYYANLVTRWKELKIPLCPRCGYNRSHSTGLVCSECGSSDPVVPAGQVPGTWTRWLPLFSETALFAPFAIFGSLGPLLVFASLHISMRILGIVVLLLTASVLAIAVTGVVSMAGRGGLPQRKS